MSRMAATLMLHICPFPLATASYLQEVLDFQVDKQSRLNQLPATVSLRRHQLALQDPTAGMDDGTVAANTAAGIVGPGGVLPGDLSEALVFSSDALDRLKHRMQVRPAGFCACLSMQFITPVAVCRNVSWQRQHVRNVTWQPPGSYVQCLEPEAVFICQPGVCC